MARLVEFENYTREMLRGIVDEAPSDRGMIFVHGFERTTLESKFKHIVDALKSRVTMFRFDFSGCGLSEGSFEDLTVEKLSKELDVAVDTFHKECPSIQKIAFVGFSLGCCIITRYLSSKKTIPEKMALFAPGFNQKQLLRYFFARQQHRDILITWDNFASYFDERAFQLDIQRHRRMMKEHYLSNTYFTENAEKDYQQDFLSLSLDSKSVLILQGTDDDKVPPASNDLVYTYYQPLLVQKGDHDLQRPDMVEQYFERLISFLRK